MSDTGDSAVGINIAPMGGGSVIERKPWSSPTVIVSRLQNTNAGYPIKPDTTFGSRTS